MEYIKKFKDLGKDDASTAGGKGASLGEMTQAGIPVPPGFVILASTFDKFLEITDLNVAIAASLDRVNHQEMETVEKASEEIGELIMGAAMPADIEASILTEFAALGEKFVAVRSSATAEDGKEHAWAGQLKSYLNTIEADLIDKVKHCWASLFTPRAIFYRFEKGLNAAKISVAVVVQQMIESEIAGIAFSVHPVTEDRNQLIIEAGYGLGEAIVSGQITPDAYVVGKAPRNIIDINVNTQTRGLYRSASGGNEWRTIAEPAASAQILTREQIDELASLVVRIEDHYGFPCDIEWSYAGGKFYIVQSRPITTLREQKNTIKFAFEYQREAPIALFYVWFYGHINAYEKLGMGKSMAEKVFAINNSGVWRAYTQQGNLEKMKAALGALDVETINSIIESYSTGYREMLRNTSLIKDKNTLSDIIGNFIIVFLLGDMAGHALQAKAWRARTDTENIFSETTKFLKQSIGEDKNFPYYTYDEIVNGAKCTETLGSSRARSLLRMKGVVSIRSDKEAVALIGDDIELVEIAHETDALELAGQIAMKGKAVGSVRVVMSRTDIGRVEKGEVVVAPMTFPDYLPALKRASAIVTDEGGITSHAAIVSRELGIPCIIGTKVATQVLHDGDRVEVDADHGIVRIIS